MAISNGNTDVVLPVSPMGIGGGGFGNGGFGGDWSAFIILFIIAAMFGNGFGGFGFGGGNAAAAVDGTFPWLLAANNNTNNAVTGGFDHAATQAQLGDIQSAITSGFSSAEVAGCNRAMDAMQTAYNNQIASMNQSFANQQALDARLGAFEMQLQNCCCENRASIAALGADVAREACADRNAISQALSQVIASNTANTQRILDQMFQDKLDAKNEQIVALQNQVNMLNLAASQTAQTQQLIADNTAQTQYIVNRVAPYPIPAYTVANPNAAPAVII